MTPHLRHLIAGVLIAALLSSSSLGAEDKEPILSSADIERAHFHFERSGIGFVDFGAEFDMPAYYFDAKTRRVISACGGLCMHRMEACEKACPPRSWIASGCEAKLMQFRSSNPRRQRTPEGGRR